MRLINRLLCCCALITLSPLAWAGLFSAKESYLIRTQVTDALVMTVPIRQAVFYSHQENGSFPNADEARQILSDQTMACETCAISLQADTGVITIEFDDRAHEALKNRTLIVVQAEQAEYAGDMQCHSETIEDRYLPYVCQSEDLD